MLLLVSIVTGAWAGGTAGRGAQPDSRDQRVAALEDACSWAPVFTGYPASRLAGYDVAVVDAVPDREGHADTSAEDVAVLRAGGTLTLAYLSVGTLERWRHYARRVPAAWTLAPVPAWEGERYVDAGRPGWRAILRHEARRLARAGFDGLLLDNLDVAAAYPRTRPGVVRAVRELRRTAPELVLVAQNGLGIASAVPIDALVHEDVFSRWERGYRATRRAETTRLLGGLRPLRDRGLPIFTLDYTAPGAPSAGRIVRRSLREGFRPAVSVLRLDRPPHAGAARRSTHGPRSICRASGAPRRNHVSDFNHASTSAAWVSTGNTG